MDIAKSIIGIAREALRLSLWFVAGTLLIWVTLNAMSETRAPRPVFNHPPILGR